MKPLPTILLCVVCVTAGIVISGLLRRTPEPGVKIETVTKLYDEMLKVQREHTEAIIQLYDERLAERARQDSILQTQYKSNTVRYEKIPVIVNSYDRDQLRRAYAEY